MYPSDWYSLLHRAAERAEQRREERAEKLREQHADASK